MIMLFPCSLLLVSLALQSGPSKDEAAQLPKVIIVGAGLAGLATALGLANTGKYRVDLVEQRLNFNRKGATFGLAPNGIMALEELDPGDQGVMASLYESGIDISEGDRRGMMYAWWLVRDALLNRVRSKSDTIRLLTGYTVQEIIDEPGRPSVQATFVPSIKTKMEAGAANHESVPSEKLTLEGCLLVGCDGVYSSVRNILGCAPPKFVGTTIWRGSIQLDPSNPMEQHQLLAPLLNKGIVAWYRNVSPTIINVFNFHSKIPGRLAWALASKVPDVPPNSHPWDLVLDPYLESDEDRKLVQAFLELSSLDDVYYPSPLCATELPSEDGNGWGGKGRVILIGDSAHSLRPASGQGGSMAFEDSVVLYRALKQLPVASTTSFEVMSKLVLQVENERLPRVRTVWNKEQLIAEFFYQKGGQNSLNLNTPEYLDWLYKGVQP